MSWPMPSGQWNSGVPMPAPGPDINMGSCTPEQWTMMQQQSWQWAQWQQQYSHWQSQYGDKFSQLQSMQAMGLAPPLPPSNNQPPAPPPPENPPPPPHENDEPLFGTHTAPTPVPPPNTNQAPNPQPSNDRHGSTQKKLNNAEECPQVVNTEALKKLSEEERIFDIQFKKWEEEIEKWKQENVNHPDKTAYSEYEQKFESCRAQLLDRRQQMKLKRARLLNNAAHPTSNKSIGNISTNIPPPQIYNKSNDYSINQSPIQQTYKDNNGPTSNNRNMSQSHQYKMQQHNYNRDSRNMDILDNRNMDLEDPNEQYKDTTEDYGPIDTDNSFLPSTGSARGIPGLDLVPEDRSKFSTQKDVIDITDDQTNHEQKSNVYQMQNRNDHQKPLPIKAPDYSTISQGINNILGDEKIMNILSMVAGQKSSMGNNQSGNSFNVNTPPQAAPLNNQWGRNDNNYNVYFNNRQPMDFNNQNVNYPSHQQNQFSNPPPLQGNYDNRQNTAPDQYYDNDSEGNQYGNPNIHLRNMPPPLMQINTQSSRSIPSIPNVPQKHPELGAHIGHNRRGFQENKESPNTSHHLIGLEQRGMQEYGESRMSSNANSFNARGLQETQQPIIPTNPHIVSNQRMQMQREPVEPPMKPKWDREPFFTPAIIVEYDHKPLRLKARDFIEPVHTFDYNHISKDGEGVNKRNFVEEADQFFSKIPRQSDNKKDWSQDRHSREDRHSLNYRDNRQSRHEFRDEHDSGRGDNFYQRRYDDRRYEERDRISRHDDPYREKEYDRTREQRERNSGKDYDRYRDIGRDRDLGRERDVGRDRDLARDKIYGRDRDKDGDRDRHMDKDRDIGRDREKEYTRDKYRDRKSDRNRSHSRDRDTRKRGVSRESDVSNISGPKKMKSAPHVPNEIQKKPTHIVMIDDILEPPGREMRPEKIAIVLRGLPGSGKSYLAKLIRDREAEYGSTARIMSIDDYFMQEGEIEEKDPVTGKIVKKPSLKYEYDREAEETYMSSLKRAFKRTITDGFFSFLIFDAVNDQLRGYADVWNFARQHGFQVYICTLELDPQACFKRNIHNRTLEDIEVIATSFFKTPQHHIQLDATTLLQSASIPDVLMEDVSVADIVDMTMDEEPEVENSFTSKWEKMEDAAQLARLDGINKPLRPSQLSMEDYLQLDDWKPNTAKPGKKTVRWADLEERREQEKMRAIGFVVGQTDWNRMTDPTMGSSALTQTKYIERVRRN